MLNRYFLMKKNSILVTRFCTLNRDFMLIRDLLNRDFTVQNLVAKIEFLIKKSQFSEKSRFKESKCADGGHSLNRDFTVLVPRVCRSVGEKIGQKFFHLPSYHHHHHLKETAACYLVFQPLPHIHV